MACGRRKQWSERASAFGRKHDEKWSRALPSKNAVHHFIDYHDMFLCLQRLPGFHHGVPVLRWGYWPSTAPGKRRSCIGTWARMRWFQQPATSFTYVFKQLTVDIHKYKWILEANVSITFCLWMCMIKFVIFTTTTLDRLSLLPRCWRLPLGAPKVCASVEGRFDFVPSFREVQSLEDVSEGHFWFIFDSLLWWV